MSGLTALPDDLPWAEQQAFLLLDGATISDLPTRLKQISPAVSTFALYDQPPFAALRDISPLLVAIQRADEPLARHEISGIERLGLRVSSMINHPVAQVQRWVKIYRLDTDGEREWEEVMGVLSDVDGIEMTFNDDESVTLRWEASAEEDRPVEVFEPVEEPAPF